MRKLSDSAPPPCTEPRHVRWLPAALLLQPQLQLLLLLLCCCCSNSCRCSCQPKKLKKEPVTRAQIFQQKGSQDGGDDAPMELSQQGYRHCSLVAGRICAGTLYCDMKAACMLRRIAICLESIACVHVSASLPLSRQLFPTSEGIADSLFEVNWRILLFDDGGPEKAVDTILDEVLLDFTGQAAPTLLATLPALLVVLVGSGERIIQAPC